MTTPPPPNPPGTPPPFPGDDPFGITPNLEAPAGGNGHEEFEQELDTGKPAVAASKGRMMAVVGVVGALVLFLLYNIFSSGESDNTSDEPRPLEVVQAQPEDTPPPIEAPTVDQAPLPMEIDAPNVVEDTPAAEETVPEFITPPPLITPEIPQSSVLAPSIDPDADAAAKEQQLARQRSQIFSVGGGGSLGGLVGGGDTAASGPIDGDPNRAFESAAGMTVAERSVATRIGNLSQIIAQGKLIQATLETAINTDLPSPIRAIVSRDVFGEAGTVPLIPKGSRLIGVYNTSLAAGQSRVFIVWQRIIRPDGVDIMIGSPGIDQIGQAGLTGQIDSKFQELFSRSVLASAISIAFAIGSDEISGGDGQTSSTFSTTGSTQSGDAVSTATNNALNRLGSVTEQFLTNFVSIRPTILVDQGTLVNVFVNRDLVFPADVAGTQVVQ